MVNGVLDGNLVKRTLPKDELQLSNFITNRDDYVFHAINRKLKREFFSVIRDDCRENLRKMKTEHFLERQLPGLHTYRLGGSNYLTAAGEVAYFYKCRPRLVAAICTDTCYDALPVEIASENVTLTTYFQGRWTRGYCTQILHRTSYSQANICSQESTLFVQILCPVPGHLWPMVCCYSKHLANRTTR